MPKDPKKENLVKAVSLKLYELTDTQIGWISELIEQFQTSHKFTKNPDSDIITEEVLHDFGDALRDHHTFSRQSFTKDRFEFALETILNRNGIPAKKSPSGNPGDDITIKLTKT